MSDRASQYDAGHLSFLELVQVITSIAGPAFTSGALVKTGLGMAKNARAQEYPDFSAFVSAVTGGDGALAWFEGPARHYGGGVLAQPTCPFAAALKTYAGYVGELPAEYAQVTEQYNRASLNGDKARVGQLAGVSPFCCVHQTLRSAIAEQIRVGENPLIIHQLGSKSRAGERAIADRSIEATGVARELVEKALDENMCCYLAMPR